MSSIVKSPDFGMALLGVALLVFVAIVMFAALMAASDADDDMEDYR